MLNLKIHKAYLYTLYQDALVICISTVLPAHRDGFVTRIRVLRNYESEDLSRER